MATLEQNIFVDGSAVTGDSFFGRKALINKLETIIFASVGNYNIVGPTRIGKSSLINQVFERNKNYPQRICIQLTMGKFRSAYAFWTILVRELQTGIRNAGLWNDTFEASYNDIRDFVSSQNEEWFSDFQYPFECILQEINAQGYRLILSIDEFDAVERLFGSESHYYQELRDIADTPKYATNCILVSRRRLHLFEATCPYISTFHGVFPELTVLPFCEEDMEEFYDALSLYDVKVTPGGKKRLERYTGNMPYLCCKIGKQMVFQRTIVEAFGDKEIDGIFKKLQPEIDRHYRDLTTRLEEDSLLDYVYYLSIGAKVPKLTDRELENLTVMGVLIPEEKNGETRYYAFSKDFMTFFRLEPLKLPAWDIMTSSEKKIKAIFKKEFPKLAETTYQDITGSNANIAMNSIDSAYPELGLNWKQIKGYSEELSTRKEQPTVLDVLTLSKIIGVMLDTWNNRFHIYFNGDASWKTKLEAIKKVRNPMAHAQSEHICPEELATCMKYCEEIIRMKY